VLAGIRATNLEDTMQPNGAHRRRRCKVYEQQPPDESDAIELPLITRSLPLALLLPLERPPCRKNLDGEDGVDDSPKEGYERRCGPIVASHAECHGGGRRRRRVEKDDRRVRQMLTSSLRLLTESRRYEALWSDGMKKERWKEGRRLDV